ncbi:hypothetical protein ACVRZR_06140 [Streptococcus entericus]
MLTSLPKEKQIWGELFMWVVMYGILYPKDKQDMTLTRIVTETSDGKRKTVYKLEIDTEV